MASPSSTFLRFCIRRDALVEVDRTFFDSGVQGAVSWGLNTNYEQLYAKGVELDEAELRQMILDRGAVPAQDLTLPSDGMPAPPTISVAPS